VHRVIIRLHDHRVSFDPPQHVATLAVEHESDGRVLELMPATGDESDDDGVAVLRRLPPSSSAPRRAIENERSGPGIDTRYLDRFPLVSEIDLANVPSYYKRSSMSNVTSFGFVPGERYAVTLVSEITLQAVVIAE
jgi:hypothetical protein